jgi:hypothetical protein
VLLEINLDDPASEKVRSQKSVNRCDRSLAKPTQVNLKESAWQRRITDSAGEALRPKPLNCGLDSDHPYGLTAKKTEFVRNTLIYHADPCSRVHQEIEWFLGARHRNFHPNQAALQPEGNFSRGRSLRQSGWAG